MWPAIIAGAAALGSTALGGLFQSQANRQNQKNLDEANAWSRYTYQDTKEHELEMLRASLGNQNWNTERAYDFNRQERLEAQEWNRKMWYEQQQYNTPAKQAERLRAAGLNPAALMNGDSAGAIGSIASSQPASAPSTSPITGHGVSSTSMQYSPMQPILSESAVSNALNTFTNALSQYEDIKGKKIENEFKRQQQIEELNNKIASTYKILADRDASKAQKDLARAQLPVYFNQAQILQHTIDRQNIVDMQNDNEYNNRMQAAADAHNQSVEELKKVQFENRINDIMGFEMNNARLEKIWAEIEELASRKHLNSSQAAYNLALKTGVDQKNQQFERLQDYLDGLIKDQYWLNHNSAFDQENFFKRTSQPGTLNYHVRGITNFIGNYLGNAIPILKLFK